jgi:Flp pilus assembly protein TadD
LYDVLMQPSSLQSQLVAIASLLKVGRLQEAEQSCQNLLARSPDTPAALHMLGLIREQAGDAAGAEQLVRRSCEYAPDNLQFRLNLAQLLRRHTRLAEAETVLRSVLGQAPSDAAARHALALVLCSLGREAEAEIECRTLLGQDSRDADAWALLGFVLGNQSRVVEAEAAYRAALSRSPSHAVSHHNLGSLLSRLERSEEALVELDRAGAAGARGFELSFNRGRALAQLYRHEDAETAFAAAVAENPGHVEAQINLARLRFMRGDADFARDFSAAAASQPDHVALQAALGTALRCAGQAALAEEHLRERLRAYGPAPELRGVLAQVLLELGRLGEAEVEAGEAAAGMPGNSATLDTLVSVLLSRGRAREAMQFISVQRQREPDVQSWVAYEATAARLLGTPAYPWLYDFDRFVRTYEVAAPEGWSSIAELNAQLLRVLSNRHQFRAHPLDQSVRAGSQTARNLLAEDDATIKAVLRAFEEPVADFVRGLGAEAAHPFTGRNRGGARIATAWSVQLRRDGFHVNHLHPQGWISSAYYVQVPEEANDRERRSGWLKFGEPRFPVPDAVPERYIRPLAGRLVLFPSYMWHGTTPIHGTQLRTSIAFDALPAPAP